MHILSSLLPIYCTHPPDKTVASLLPIHTSIPTILKGIMHTIQVFALKHVFLIDNSDNPAIVCNVHPIVEANGVRGTCAHGASNPLLSFESRNGSACGRAASWVLPKRYQRMGVRAHRTVAGYHRPFVQCIGYPIYDLMGMEAPPPKLPEDNERSFANLRALNAYNRLDRKSVV